MNNRIAIAAYFSLNAIMEDYLLLSVRINSLDLPILTNILAHNLNRRILLLLIAHVKFIILIGKLFLRDLFINVFD